MLTIKPEQLVTSGVFAKLAGTTKKTIRVYTDYGLLRPKRTNSKGYRFYSIEQIIDLQVIMLLRKLNFSLAEIKKFIRKNASAEELFLKKKQELLVEVAGLQTKIQDITDFYTNLKNDGILVKPTIKQSRSFKAYFIEKAGPYSKIYDYCFELKACFSEIPVDATYFVLFPDREYSPKKDRLKIGVVASRGMHLKLELKNNVKKELIPALKTLSYKHVGSAALVSMIIMQMHQYMALKNIKQDLRIPINEIEFYKNSLLNGNPDENSMISEINIPIR